MENLVPKRVLIGQQQYTGLFLDPFQGSSLQWGNELPVCMACGQVILGLRFVL